MDKCQKEVTDEIRSAIRKKLVEINAFVDDELPEYIMLLVANKRSKAQIAKDLYLFLNNDATKFTNWLETLLKSLKVAPKGFDLSSDVQRETENSNIKVEIDEDIDVLDYDPTEQGDSLGCEDTGESATFRDLMVKNEAVTKTNDHADPPAVEASKTIKTSSVDKIKKLTLPQKNEIKTATSRAIPSIISRSNHQRVVSSADEYDPNKPDIAGSISSVVCVTRRNYSGVAALQTNKLLLRAVDDATKSVLEGKNINDYYKPTPIKVLTSKHYGNIRFPRSNTHVSDNLKSGFIQQPAVLTETATQQDVFSRTLKSLDEISENLSNECTDYSHTRTICLKNQCQISPMSGENSESKLLPNDNRYSVVQSVEEECSKQPHFFVTLEGVDMNTLKRKHVDVDEVENMEEDEEEENMSYEENMIEPTADKKQKLNERCKYWPACKNSDHCMYYHPTVPCKCFPDCKFGDKCLYIHPNCKFDALCSRKDCPFTHASKRKLSLLPPPIHPVPLKVRTVKTVCKFYPKCMSKKCPFIHPKLCRYGTECRSPKCPYSHFHVPSRNQMKWQAHA